MKAHDIFAATHGGDEALRTEMILSQPVEMDDFASDQLYMDLTDDLPEVNDFLRRLRESDEFYN